MSPTTDDGRGRLSGKRAIVVGAGQTPGALVGMGRASSLLFAREGAQVMLVDRNSEWVEETASLLRDEGHDPLVCVADITVADDCRRVVDETMASFGGIDVLQNTVGIHGSGDPTELDEAKWDRVLEVNLKGMWLTSKHVLMVMRAQRAGSVVNYSSLAGLPGRANGVYGISKAGVNALTTSLAFFNAPYHIRVNAILPGALSTTMAFEGWAEYKQWGELTAARRDELAAGYLAMAPMGFAGDAWDCARLGVFLASDDSRYISGACLPVDGAYSSGSFHR
jgi:NAD(P)-dependent dehydrogenase (short-subunit alcohol dehydrogenase family)